MTNDVCIGKTSRGTLQFGNPLGTLDTSTCTSDQHFTRNRLSSSVLTPRLLLCIFSSDSLSTSTRLTVVQTPSTHPSQAQHHGDCTSEISLKVIPRPCPRWSSLDAFPIICTLLRLHLHKNHRSHYCQCYFSKPQSHLYFLAPVGWSSNFLCSFIQNIWRQAMF